eukprot:Awhi_evm1s3649
MKFIQQDEEDLRSKEVVLKLSEQQETDLYRNSGRTNDKTNHFNSWENNSRGKKYDCNITNSRNDHRNISMGTARTEFENDWTQKGQQNTTMNDDFEYEKTLNEINNQNRIVADRLYVSNVKPNGRKFNNNNNNNNNNNSSSGNNNSEKNESTSAGDKISYGPTHKNKNRSLRIHENDNYNRNKDRTFDNNNHRTYNYDNKFRADPKDANHNMNVNTNQNINKSHNNRKFDNNYNNFENSQTYNHQSLRRSRPFYDHSKYKPLEINLDIIFATHQQQEQKTISDSHIFDDLPKICFTCGKRTMLTQQNRLY